MLDAEEGESFFNKSLSRLSCLICASSAWTRYCSGEMRQAYGVMPLTSCLYCLNQRCSEDKPRFMDLAA
jgi:hypothetical protein